MALAILIEKYADGNQKQFEANVGTNHYYQIAIGDETRRADNGVLLLDNKSYTSSLEGPLSPSQLGRTLIAIPKNNLSRTNRYVQLISYRNKKKQGPAYSDILSIADVGHVNSFTTNNTYNMNHQIPVAKSKAFHYKKEIQQAEAMGFLQEIGKIAQAILPAVGEMISKDKKGEEKKGGIAAIFQNKDLMKIFSDLLGGLGKKKETTTNEESESLSLAYQNHSSAQTPVLSKAAWAQFIPLIAEVAKSPDMWNGLNKFHETSINFINDLFGGTLTDFSNFGDDTTNVVQQILQQDAMEKMAELQLAAQAKAKAQSIAFSNQELKESGLDFLRVESVELELPDSVPGKGHQWASIVFDADQDNPLNIKIETPRKIQKALLKVCVKPIKGTTALLEKKKKVYDLYNGSTQQVIFEPHELEQLHHGEEYHLSIRLIWPNKKGLRIGTSASRLLMVTGELSYGKVIGSTGETHPLNDVENYRSFWHKVWAETFTKDRRQLALDVKYYSTLDLDDEANSRLDSLSKIEVDRGSKFQGRLKSGMEYSLESLNALLPLISDYPMLEQEELDALRNTNFDHYATKVARKKVLFKGRPDESFALWSHPEVEIHKIELNEGAAINSSDVDKHIVHFPIPVKIHLIGTQVL